MADIDDDKKADPPATDPPPPPPPPPATDPPPPPAPPSGDADKDDLRTVVKGLSDVVAGLVTTVTAMVDGQLANDKTPTSVPWTHRGSGRK